MIPLDHLPEIGERIFVQVDSQGRVGSPVPATIISMHECQQLQPDLWGDAFGTFRRSVEMGSYGPDDTIRAWKYDEPSNGRLASFCIMRFSGTLNGSPSVTYNRFIFTMTNRECHELAAGMNLELAFFTRNNIDPDAPCTRTASSGGLQPVSPSIVATP